MCMNIQLLGETVEVGYFESSSMNIQLLGETLEVGYFESSS